MNATDETYGKLRAWVRQLSSSSTISQLPEAPHSLSITMDEVVWILSRLRKLFNMSNYSEQKRLMTMLPESWGRKRVANWFGGLLHQARCSINLRESIGAFAQSENRRGNKPLDGQIEQIVQRFYISEECSRETSYKKQVIHPGPSRDPVPLRFLHLTIGETFEQFKMKHPYLIISRSKFFSLRPEWVRERTPQESCMCLYHENADLLLRVTNLLTSLIHRNIFI